MKPFLITSALVCCVVFAILFVNTVTGIFSPFWGGLGMIIIFGALLGCIETLKEL